jgi:hypothetical protein
MNRMWTDARPTHLMQSISMRCCSARLFSLFTFLWSAVKMDFLSASALPHCLFISRSSSLGIPVVISVRAKAPGTVMEKYSSSSRRTMMACLERRGFWDPSAPPSVGSSARDCCAWKRPGERGVP